MNSIPLGFFDWAIMLVYFAFIVWIGFYLKKFTKTDDDFFLAGRRNSMWVCGIAFMSANMGSMEVIGYVGQTIKYGLYAAHFYLIGAENPPGSKYISGSQDHIGLLNPGISRLFYKGDYWPEQIDSTIEKETCEWLSTVLHLIPVNQRPDGFDPIKEKNLIKNEIKELGDSGEECWQSIIKKDIVGLGKSMTKSFYAWKKILPFTVPDHIMQEMETNIFPNYYGAIRPAAAAVI